MKTRVISATVLIILVVACFALGPVTRALFLLAATVMAIWETCRAIGCKDVHCAPWVLYLFAVGTAAAIWFKASPVVYVRFSLSLYLPQ